MDFLLNSRWVLLITLIGFAGVVFLIVTRTYIDRRKLKKIEQNVKDWDEKLVEEWNIKQEEQKRREEKLKTETARKEAEKEAAEREKENEILATLETKRADFFISPENKFVERFAKKYADRWNENELAKLQTVLKNRQWDFSLLELKLLLARELEKQFRESVKSKILVGESGEQQKIIEIYLDNYHADDENALAALAEILKEKSLFEGSLQDLRRTVSECEENLEAEKFADILLNDESAAP